MSDWRAVVETPRRSHDVWKTGAKQDWLDLLLEDPIADLILRMGGGEGKERDSEHQPKAKLAKFAQRLHSSIPGRMRRIITFLRVSVVGFCPPHTNHEDAKTRRNAKWTGGRQAWEGLFHQNRASRKHRNETISKGSRNHVQKIQLATRADRSADGGESRGTF
jgi:hypothetical protein